MLKKDDNTHLVGYDSEYIARNVWKKCISFGIFSGLF